MVEVRTYYQTSTNAVFLNNYIYNINYHHFYDANKIDNPPLFEKRRKVYELHIIFQETDERVVEARTLLRT